MRQLYIILFFLTSTVTFACDCEWGGNFISSSKHSDIIIKAKVVELLWHFEDGKTLSSSEDFGDYLVTTTATYYQSIKVEVIELIKGKEHRKVFEIYGSDGVDCRESIHIFELNKTYIFAIYKTEKTDYSQPNEDEKDYAIGGCSEKWLEFLPETNSVKGYIKGKKRRKKISFSYEKLLKEIQ